MLVLVHGRHFKRNARLASTNFTYKRGPKFPHKFALTHSILHLDMVKIVARDNTKSARCILHKIPPVVMTCDHLDHLPAQEQLHLRHHLHTQTCKIPILIIHHSAPAAPHPHAISPLQQRGKARLARGLNTHKAQWPLIRARNDVPGQCLK
jgi:hypothetical protein